VLAVAGVLAVVAVDLVVAELVVAALHEVARQAGADARLEVSPCCRRRARAGRRSRRRWR
jgi:hypothetical protein